MLTLAWQPGQSSGCFRLEPLQADVDVFRAFPLASQVQRQRRDHLISPFRSLLCKRSVDAFRAATAEHYFKTDVRFKNMQKQLELLRLLFKR